jgi:glycosyltransferase involved in cell wall biosynthesis
MATPRKYGIMVGIMENNDGLLASQSTVALLEEPRPHRGPSAPRSTRKTTAPPLISIIIPAHNEQDYIRRTLEAANSQTLRNFEVIVVCNGCSDRTAHEARQFCDQVIVMPERGLSRARNLGGQAARGRILAFLDADTLLEHHALEVIARQFTPEFAAGTLKGCPDLPRPSYQLMYFIKNSQHRLRLHEGSSGVILCWKEHFIATGGFDEALHVTENSDLIRKLRFFGKYTFIGDTCVTTSMRRYETTGFVTMFCLWIKLWVRSFVTDLRHHKYAAIR